MNTELDQATAECELRAFLDELPEEARQLILEQGTLGYLRELHRCIGVLLDEAFANYVSDDLQEAHDRLAGLLPPL